MCKMPRYLAALAFLFCWPSMLLAEDAPQPTYVAQVGPNQLFILPEPCPLGGWFSKWRKARWVFNGETFDACWRVERSIEGGVVVKTVDSAGDTGSVPLAIFKKNETI